jgi:hypothetical protein
MIESEVSPARLRYELPKLGIAGSNPALRTFFNTISSVLQTNLLPRPKTYIYALETKPNILKVKITCTFASKPDDVYAP